MLEMLKSAEIIIGLAITIFSALVGVLVWIDRRQRARVKEGVSELVKDQKVASEKVAEVEQRVEELEGDIQTNLGELDRRVLGLERSMETVARQGDIANVQRALGSLEATVKASSTQVAMMFEAQLRREKGDS